MDEFSYNVGIGKGCQTLIKILEKKKAKFDSNWEKKIVNLLQIKKLVFQLNQVMGGGGTQKKMKCFQETYKTQGQRKFDRIRIKRDLPGKQ